MQKRDIDPVSGVRARLCCIAKYTEGSDSRILLFTLHNRNLAFLPGSSYSEWRTRSSPRWVDLAGCDCAALDR
jgi:hypothetical protein